MRYWNVGMLVWRYEIYFNLDDTDQKLKSGHHPLFIPNIPFFHHSIIPNVTDGRHQPSGVKSKADAFGQDY
jgi:hypothetical protein